MVDPQNTTIIMEFIKGKPLKQLLNSVSSVKRRYVCCKIGELIGLLHEHGIVHGDLTTSNMIQQPEGNVVFLDFGLGEKTNELEAKGVDLHLMKRALQSTHYRFAEDCFTSVMKGYSKDLAPDAFEDVLRKIREIERRGRYVVERKEIV
jgi:TP53 regulating kinase-like protein